jgi:TonB family protein
MALHLHPFGRPVIRPCCVLMLAFGLRDARAQRADAAPASSQPVVVATDMYQPPRIKDRSTPAYPLDEARSGVEGWVILSAMVDQHGKPYEAAVIDSTGQKVLENQALRSLNSWTLIPAQLNGHPVDSVFQVKFHFAVSGRPLGARAEFVSQRRKLLEAIHSNDKAAADAALAALNVQNLYEDAFKGLAQYSYAVQYGDVNQQIAGLQRAIANESDARYLPRDTFAAALENLLRLQIQTNRYAEALETWDTLQKASHDAPLLARIRPLIDQVHALRSDGRPYSVAGDLKDEGWFIKLFRDNFRIKVFSGQVRTLRLRCERTYRMFDFDPQLEYHIASKSGQCELEVDGAPGSRFYLVQS